MKVKIAIVIALGLLAFAGVAQAAGLLSSRPASSPHALQKRVKTLTHKLEKAGQRNVATASKKRQRGRRGRRGRRGPPGSRGASGGQGVPGAFASILHVTSPPTFLCNWEFLCSVGSATATCPAGTTVIGGGWGGLGIFAVVSFSGKSANGWGVVAINWEDAAVTNFRAKAVCVS